MTGTSPDEHGLPHFWSVDLPKHLDRLAPPLADAFADGVWTAGWRKVNAFAPIAAMATGALFRLVWPSIHNVYSESQIFLMLAVAGAILSGPVGAMLLLGYAAGDLIAMPFAHSYVSGPLAYLGLFGGHVIGYMLLAIPLILIPQLGRRMTDEIAVMIARGKEPPVAVRALLYAASAAVLVFLWCQAMIVLVRPIFTWTRQSPTTEAVKQVQTRWVWLVGVAVVAVLVRAALEAFARARHGPLISRFEAERWSSVSARGALWRGLPVIVRVLLAAAVVTLVLAGTYVSRVDGVIVFAVVVVLKAWRAGLLGSLPVWWNNAIRRIPALARVIIAVAVGFVPAGLLIRLFWSTGSLRPVMVGALITLAIFHLFFPQPSRKRAAA